MSDSPSSDSHKYTGEHRHHNGGGDINGRRWTDSAKVVWALISAISFIILSWGGVVYTTAHGAETKNVEQDVKINWIEGKVDKIDAKLDRILERMPK